ncbi:antitoxin VapB family protein [Halobaculum sp. MBLA0147]|uniref:antitoxin VapB family protein n=1 Tax=Halobaculum sp. MBLA0147 TaxID=3079934 RepID=UPI003525A46C
MPTKSLTITEEAYDRLRAHKRPDESFTETIIRLTDAEGDPADGFGAMADTPGFAAAVADAREQFDADARERLDDSRERQPR